MIGTTRRSLMFAAAAVAFTLAGCSGGSTDGAVGGTSAGTASSGSPASSGTATAPASPSTAPSGTPTEAFARTVTLSVRGRKVTPAPGRVKVSEGDKVRIVVTSDVANTVHVHGVDVEKDVPAGRPTTIVVTMDESGVYEVEMHHPALLLFQFEVR